MKRNFTYFFVVLVTLFMYSCGSDDDPIDVNNNPTSNYFTFGDTYFEVTHGAVAYYGENDYDFFIADATWDDDDNITKYAYFDLGSLSNDYVASGTYNYSSNYDRTPGTFVDGEFWANEGETSISSSGQNPFDKGSKSARVITVDDNYYGVTGGTITVVRDGENQYTMDFSLTCKKYDENWDLTGESITFTGNFSGTFEYIDETSNYAETWLYVQFVDRESGEILHPDNFNDYDVLMYESEDDYYNEEYATGYFNFYNTYGEFENVFEFYGLATDIEYYMSAYFEDDNGYYETAGYLGSYVQEGENFLTVYVDYHDGSSETVWLYVQFLDNITEEVLHKDDFSEVYVYLFEDEASYNDWTNEIEYSGFYEEYSGFTNVFEFFDLSTTIDYILYVGLGDDNGYYETAGYLGAYLEPGDNFYYVYVEYVENGGKKQMEIKRVEKQIPTLKINS